jgi:hypothetical protein
MAISTSKSIIQSELRFFMQALEGRWSDGSVDELTQRKCLLIDEIAFLWRGHLGFCF